jgi:hypothetical protein
MLEGAMGHLHYSLFLAVSLLLLGPSTAVNRVSAVGTNYYVDSVAGSDANSGLSESAPWKTLSKIQTWSFSPGDTVNFKCGSSWSSGLTFRRSGTARNPITLKAYGSGAAPVISNPGARNGHSIDVAGSYVIVRDFLLRDGKEAGVSINPGANNVIVQHNEITASGEGVLVKGGNALVTRNYVHDLVMVHNDSGGDDDYGAVAVVLDGSSNTEVSYNRFVNCVARSYDYGTDGGAIEFWRNVTGANAHHNYSTNAAGFMEIGGGTAERITVAYNVSDRDNSDFAMVHLTGRFAATVTNFKVDNNTIVRSDGGYRILDFGGATPPSSFYFRNNIVYGNTSVASVSGFTHSNNLYYLSNGARLDFALGPSDRQADPQFANEGSADYHLRPGSPAIGSGTELGYTLDFDNNPVPVGRAPSIGAYESGLQVVSPGKQTAPTAQTGPAEAPPPETPRFILGFATMANLLGEKAGSPLENERHDPESGDGLQQTTTGLMVWRKVDNWSAFTDGSHTWVNGPSGLADRPNDVRFPWESQ